MNNTFNIFRTTEIALHVCSRERLVWKISPNSQGNTYDEDRSEQSCRPSVILFKTCLHRRYFHLYLAKFFRTASQDISMASSQVDVKMHLLLIIIGCKQIFLIYSTKSVSYGNCEIAMSYFLSVTSIMFEHFVIMIILVFVIKIF